MGSLKYHWGLPHGWQDPKFLDHLHCFSRCISRELYQNSQDLNQHSYGMLVQQGLFSPYHCASPWSSVFNCKNLYVCAVKHLRFIGLRHFCLRLIESICLFSILLCALQYCALERHLDPYVNLLLGSGISERMYRGSLHKGHQHADIN